MSVLSGVIVFILLFGVGYISLNPPRPETPVSAPTPFSSPVDNNPSVPTFSPQQKIGQMIAVSLKLSNPVLGEEPTRLTPDQVSMLRKIQPGFVVIYGRKISFTTVRVITNSLKDLNLPFPLLVAVDHEGGVVQRLRGEGFSPLKSWEELCQENPQVRKTAFQTSAQELSAAGVDIVLGPVIDFSLQKETALPTRICNSDLQTLLESSSEIIEIYQQAGVTPTLKHFPGIGSLQVDLHNTYAEVEDTEQAISNFKQLLDNHPNIAVMTSHAGLPGENKPCSLSENCLNFLAEYSQGLIITDDINMPSAAHTNTDTAPPTLTERAEQAIRARNTVILLGPEISLSQVEAITQELTEIYKDDQSFADLVDAGFTQVLQWRAKEKTTTLH